MGIVNHLGEERKEKQEGTELYSFHQVREGVNDKGAMGHGYVT